MKNETMKLYHTKAVEFSFVDFCVWKFPGVVGLAEWLSWVCARVYTGLWRGKHECGELLMSWCECQVSTCVCVGFGWGEGTIPYFILVGNLCVAYSDKASSSSSCMLLVVVAVHIGIFLLHLFSFQRAYLSICCLGFKIRFLAPRCCGK